jgi:hypothetical protein
MWKRRAGIAPGTPFTTAPTESPAIQRWRSGERGHLTNNGKGTLTLVSHTAAFINVLQLLSQKRKDGPVASGRDGKSPVQR